ncbi:MAG: hypothetical protein A2019_03715 [Sulfurimonas sp. GWF2_37_8]|nr:MAG: hypothetical protein A2019_03715 [Sulfurimonas sp. GWF2_37_8]
MNPNEIERDKKIYKCAKTFLLKKSPEEVTEEIIESYLRNPAQPRSEILSLEKIFLSFLVSAQNANMKAGVIGGSINGVQNLGQILFDFNPKKVYQNFQDSEKLLAEIIEKLAPNGAVRKTEKSIWPKYCKTIISMSEFLSQFENADDFFKWTDFFYNDRRSISALPLILSEEVYGIGFPLACDFLKELGYVAYGKPDVHIKDIFEAYELTPKNATNYQILKSITRIASNVGEHAYNVDKLFWLIGSGKFYNHKNIQTKRLKDEFIKQKCSCV